MTEYRRRDRDLPEALLLESDGLFDKWREERTPKWERNTVSVASCKTREEFCWAMYEQARRHVEEYQAEVGLNVPWWLLDKREEWRNRWLASQSKSSNVMSDIVAQLQAKESSE